MSPVLAYTPSTTIRRRGSDLRLQDGRRACVSEWGVGAWCVRACACVCGGGVMMRRPWAARVPSYRYPSRPPGRQECRRRQLATHFEVATSRRASSFSKSCMSLWRKVWVAARLSRQPWQQGAGGQVRARRWSGKSARSRQQAAGSAGGSREQAAQVSRSTAGAAARPAAGAAAGMA